MGSLHQLASLARRLNREAGAPAAPSLYFFTDPERTPDPMRIAKRLPHGTAIVYRHFGADDRLATAQRLSDICRARGLHLLIGADPALAQRVGAAGVHWPQRLAPAQRELGAMLITVSAHSAHDLDRAARLGADACVLSPVFPTRSASGRRPLGLFRAGRLARAASLPVIALGGVNADTARRLVGRSFAGLAGVDAFLEA